jgi:hypothetical protein
VVGGRQIFPGRAGNREISVASSDDPSANLKEPPSSTSITKDDVFGTDFMKTECHSRMETSPFLMKMKIRKQRRSLRDFEEQIRNCPIP